MPAIIEVPRGHPLHFTHTFAQMLPLGDVDVTSIQMGYYYFYLQHHDKPEAAAKLLSDPQLMWNPELMFNNLVRPSVPTPNIKFVIKAVEVMRSIVLYQLQCQESPFKDAILRELDKIPEEDRPAFDVNIDFQFRVYSCNNEHILSCGRPYGQWRDDVRGFNCYAEILREAFDIVFKEKKVLNNLFPKVASNFEFFHPPQEKSVLIVSDSQGKFFDKIVGGMVIPISGGNFGHVVKAFNRGDVDYMSYKWIIVYCGTNCRAKSHHARVQQDFEWRNLREILVREAARRGDGSVLFCPSFEHPFVQNTPGLTSQIERDLRGTGVQCVKWHENPFLGPDGRPKEGLYDTFAKKSAYARGALIHINHAGLTILWKIWCEYIPEVRFVPMTMTSQHLAIPKWVIQDIEDEALEEVTPARLPSSLSRVNVGSGRQRFRQDRYGQSGVVSRTNVGGDSLPSTSSNFRAYESGPSTSRGPEQNAEAGGGVIPINPGDPTAASRKRAPPAAGETERNESRAAASNERAEERYELYYEKQGRYTPHPE